MMWQLRKQYFLYLKGSHLLGVELQGREPRKVLDTSLEELHIEPEVTGEATLLLDREGLQHQIVTIPARGRFPLKKTMAHEVESLMDCSPSELIYDWRGLGNTAEEEIPEALYLLAAYRRPELLSLLEEFSLQGIRVTRIISALDLIIEKGRALHTIGGSALMLFEEPLVHFIFFRDGIYGFQRTFELRGEAFAKDLLLEIQRSFFYTKQKFKVPIEKVSILLAPDWLQGDLSAQLEATLGVPVDFLSPRLGDCSFPDLKLLNVLIHDVKLASSLLDLLPKEISRTIETRRLAWAITFTESVLLCLALLWAYNNRESLKRDVLFSEIQARQLRSVQTRIEGEHDTIARYRRVEEETNMVNNYLTRKKNLHHYFESLPFLIPENVHLESVVWGTKPSELRGTVSPGPTATAATDAPNVLIISGKVDSVSLDQRYSLFFQFLNNLEASPFVQRVNYDSEEVIAQGTFEITVHLKEVRPADGLN